MAHSRFSPSASDRWLECPGSIAASDGLPNVTSVYAEEGTRAHELLEMALRIEVDPMELVNPENEGAKAMAEAVGHVVDYVNAWLAVTPGGEYHTELTLVWGAMWGRKDLFGTTDVVLTSPSEHAVVDLKYGQGVLVEADDNTQLQTYLVGVRAMFGARPKYKVVIIQPRAYHDVGPVRVFELTDEELLAYADRLIKGVRAAEAPNAPRVAGNHCRWCLAAPVCRTLADHSLRVAAVEFSAADAEADAPMELRPTENLDSFQLAKLLRYLPLVDVWVKAVNGEALRRALSGDHLPGYKLVLGKPQNRSWSDPALVKEALKKLGLKEDEYAPRELVSPAGAERVMKANKLAKEAQAKVTSLAVRGQASPTLTEESDPRAEYVPFNEFKELPNE